MIVVMTKEDIASGEQMEGAEKSVKRAFKTLGVKEIPKIIRVNLPIGRNEGRSDQSSQKSIEELITGNGEASSSSLPSLPSPLIAIDHCFAVKGKGNVMTGSVLNGEIRVGTEIEIGMTKERRESEGITVMEGRKGKDHCW
ncbi:hypothetical protein PENTCL1PPCAC_22527 [Pristionchus entomophagus]|uniref:Translation elongation factor EFTu-like domain-containing protein n=1 Tax=Pristionchus entomophagus TaxID=358040 RepID=A0AAV5U1W7_9BILA|nr:hypothetical protein PENTCL1PPCAC_22527 [Pristionchus entomophagus]